VSPRTPVRPLYTQCHEVSGNCNDVAVPFGPGFATANVNVNSLIAPWAAAILADSALGGAAFGPAHGISGGTPRSRSGCETTRVRIL
jgi:hypothetical protein